MEAIQYKSHSQSVRQIFNLFTDGRLNLQPTFQRSGVWLKRQRTHLLESIFQGYPIPAIFLYRRADETSGQVVFEVVDGKQRIESLLMYAGHLRGRFAVPIQVEESGLPQDLTWQQLRKQKIQGRLEEYQVQTIEVSGGLSDIVELFVRINSTGNALTRQEIRNAHFYKSEFLKTSKRLASRYEGYLQSIGVIGGQQARRMKHIELMSELIYSASVGGVGNKKRVLDMAMRADSLKGAKLAKAAQSTATGLNRLRRMFPDLSRSVRFHKLSDFYSLAVLVQTFEAKGLVLEDKTRNRLAWELLTAVSTGVDELSRASKNLEIKTLSPREELLRQYLGAVREGSDSESNRRKRHEILSGLLEPIFEKKDDQRLFSSEQRRILWNTAHERVCADCGCELKWNDFQADHIKPYTLGGKTALENAALLCARHNASKGKRFRGSGL
jgi:hypothetical protein